jgi:hypothetical protein
VHRGKQWIGAAAAAVVIVVAGAVVLHQRRDREWAHGGDPLTVDVDVSPATGRDFDELVAAAGVPKGRAVRVDNASQTVIVRVGWRGHTGGGHLELMALDKRVTPPKPLVPDGGWDGARTTGWGWAGSYAVLAERYDYLARAGDAGMDGGKDLGSVGVPGTGDGTVVAWFHQAPFDSIPFRDLAGELLVVVFQVDDDGEVRWARRVHG